MKRINKTLALMMTCLLVAFSSVFVACDDSDAPDTNQIKGGVSLNAAQLQVTRGGYMQFKGSGLDQIETIVFPGNVTVADIEVVDNYTIRCLVPEAAVPGKVKMIYGDKTIETGAIAFTEPIKFEGFSPANVKAGDTLTIKGTYLNYIDHVMFATGEAVAVTPTRYEIKVVVPVDASTGRVFLAMTVVEGTETLINQIAAKEELVVAKPTEIKLPDTKVKAGSTISITGSLLRLVKTVHFLNADGVNVAQADPTKDITSISVAVPANALSGEVVLGLHSGIVIPAGEIKLVEPTAAIADLKPSYGIDETVVISGTDLDLVTKAAFTGGEAAAVTLTEGKINLKVTAAVKSGVITLTLANGNTLSVAGFETTKPVATFPSNATPLDELSIVSTLGSRVKTVKFGDLEAPAIATDKGFKVKVPLDAQTAPITMIMDNGEIVAVDIFFTISAYTFCAVAEFAEETTTVGSLLKCTVVNGANLKDVKLNGNSTGYILNGNVLFVNVGRNTGTQTMTLVSVSGTEVPYEVKVVGAGLVETVLYDTPLEINGWGGVDLPVAIDVPLPANSKIRIRVAKANSDLQVIDGYWGMGPNWAITDDAKKNTIVFSSDALKAGYVDVDFSGFHDENGNAWWDGKIKFNADGVIVSSVSVITDYSPAKTIYDTPVTIGGWDKSAQIEASVFASATVGQVITVVTSGVASDAQGSLKTASDGWPAIASGTEYFDIKGDFTLPITADVLTKLKSTGLIVSGKNYTIEKVTLK
ncbi:hypothetical protein LX69_01646 [Breznakibacter xylanolyticus]|uniref:IPT/TIG domain-containing protein n=1 Tax=Breznakibacter xylanolyticus TaxID=990 RepID=A0A2W7P054_9BACT|nr:hypothetical protein [Breznakibacter xylanolyticus]PZX16832.1 hypothetical protein LX69_01646 [Breznakibacter xylanolyticus]